MFTVVGYSIEQRPVPLGKCLYELVMKQFLAPRGRRSDALFVETPSAVDFRSEAA